MPGEKKEFPCAAIPKCYHPGRHYFRNEALPEVVYVLCDQHAQEERAFPGREYLGKVGDEDSDKAYATLAAMYYERSKYTRDAQWF